MLLDRSVFSSSHIRSQLDGLVYVERVSGSLSAYDFNGPLIEQILSVEIFGKNFSSKSLGFNTSDISFAADLNAGTLNYTIDLSESSYPQLSASIEAIGLYGRLSIESGIYNVSSDYTLRKASFFENSATIHKVDGHFESREFEFLSTSLNATLESIGVNIGDTYYGKLPTSTFQTEVKLNLQNNSLTSSSELRLNSIEKQKITGLANLIVELDGNNFLSECFLSNCPVSKINLEYGAIFDEERIDGKSYCNSQPCNFRNLLHNVRTSNTVKVFQALSLSDTLSPLVLAYLYSELLSGDKLGQGHELNFSFRLSALITYFKFIFGVKNIFGAISEYREFYQGSKFYVCGEFACCLPKR